MKYWVGQLTPHLHNLIPDTVHVNRQYFKTLCTLNLTESWSGDPDVYLLDISRESSAHVYQCAIPRLGKHRPDFLFVQLLLRQQHLLLRDALANAAIMDCRDLLRRQIHLFEATNGTKFVKLCFREQLFAWDLVTAKVDFPLFYVDFLCAAGGCQTPLFDGC